MLNESSGASGGHTAEVIVVGAGPAGSVTAALLARGGRDVLLLDRCRFPRDKPCGEVLNPTGVAILQELGVLDRLPATAWRTLRGLRLRGADGTAVELDYPGDPPPRALSIPRLDLDLALVEHAIAAGARFVPECTVQELIEERDRITGVWCKSGEGRTESLRARLVVAADGAHSRLARRAGLRRATRERRVALVGHFRGVAAELDQVEMHALGWGYCGFALHRPGEATAAMVVRESQLPALQGRSAGYFTERLRSFAHIHAQVDAAELVAPPRVTTPVSTHSVRPAIPGLLLVGDAAGFFDPFTGRGITRALRGARYAAEAAEALLEGRSAAKTLHRYQAQLTAIDAGRLVERAIRFVVDRPHLLRRAIRRFQQSPELGRILLGVAGDLRPAGDVLNPSYLARLLLNPVGPLPPSRKRPNDEGAPLQAPLPRSQRWP